MHTCSEPAPLVVHAPGKLVLMGEYAVLDGAPAVVLAIDRGVACHAWPGRGPLHIETPTGDDRFVRPALRGRTGRYRFSSWNPVHLRCTTANLALSARPKAGFGGSAAACVAACIAARRPPEDAFAIHHQVQGSGSGIDIAASIYGGMLRFQGGHTTPLPPLQPVVIWSGRSARTGPRVQCYQAWRDRAAFVRESTALVSAFAKNPISGLARARVLLEDMAQRAGLEYTTPEIDQICALAQEAGGSAKPSGAGGGDCVVALFPDAGAAQAFTATCEAAGFQTIPVRSSPGAALQSDGMRYT